MKLLRNGKKYLVALVILISGCRSSTPPAIEICIGDSFGGAYCSEIDGSRKYRPPSELANYWMTNQEDQAKFASWCYDINEKYIRDEMQKIRLQLDQ